MAATNYCAPSLHILLFPFMAKGHTIPLLDLARLLLLHRSAVTIITTPSNHPFIFASLSDTTATIVTIPFPKSIDGESIDGVPDGIESTDKLPSMSLFLPFATSTKLMQPDFETALENLIPSGVTCMITDGFFGWTADSAAKFSIPRLVYYGMSNFVGAMTRAMATSRVLLETESDDELFTVPNFPRIKLTRNDFGPPFTDRQPGSPLFDFIMDQISATSKSYGLIVNSFHELEPTYSDFLHSESKPKPWSIGPLCLAQSPKYRPETSEKPNWILWLDEMLELGKPVMYVAFGSQAEISLEQFEEIKIGLENSEANFLWVVRKNENGFNDGFEERVKGRGMVVREWVDQREILGHESVKGFLSHCGWNSVLEGICAKVPILAWPMMAEQHLNARMVVEEIKIGIRVETCDGSVRGFVKWHGLEKTVRELMEGEMGKVARKKVKEAGDAAVKAAGEGGSSWRTLTDLVNELGEIRKL